MSTRQEVQGDNRPDQQTEVYTVQELGCRNKHCTNFDKIVETLKTKIYP